MKSNLLKQLIQSLSCMPGIGPKSAQRIAFHLLSRNRQGGKQLSVILNEAMTSIDYCQSCRTFSEENMCEICQNNKRDQSILCVVESPADQYVIEQTNYDGLYFVLHGRLSPLDGIGPSELNINLLNQRLFNGSIYEVIIATSATIEGETTAHYIAQLCDNYPSINCSRIAYGIPLGSELEYVDAGTLTRALGARSKMQQIK